MRRGLLMSLAVLAAAVVPVSPAAARSGGPVAPSIQSSTLTQSGQSLVWTLAMRSPFSPARLGHDHRSLCLVLRRGHRGGSLCVTGPARGSRAARLRFTPFAGGRAQLVAAVVTRGSARELTATFLPAAAGLTYAPVRWQAVSALTTHACTATPQPAGCTTAFPARPSRARLRVPRLVGCVPAGPSLVYDGSPARREIALTFDDGPWSDTPQFLSILEHAHAVATFFEIGDQVSEYGERGAIERRMLADGDMIGDHTWNHADVAGGGSFAAGEITRAAAAIRSATGGFQPCLFRAPYGATSPALAGEARALGFLTIGWDIDPRDWALPGTSAIYQNVIDHAHNGAIVIQHDGGGNRSQTLAALPREISTLRAEGYRLVTVADLLGLRLIYK